MKQILAIIRPRKMRETKEALVKAGFSAFTGTKVLGRGRGNIDFRVLHAAEIGTEEAIARLGDGPLLISKRLMNIVVPDDKAGTLIQTIIDINKTGTAGDGKIFVLPLHETIRIRTGERDTNALQEQ